MGASGSVLPATDLDRDSSRLHRQRDPNLSILKPRMLPIGRQGPASGVPQLTRVGLQLAGAHQPRCSRHVLRATGGREGPPASGINSLRAMGALHATLQLAGAAAALQPTLSSRRGRRKATPRKILRDLTTNWQIATTPTAAEKRIAGCTVDSSSIILPRGLAPALQAPRLDPPTPSVFICVFLCVFIFLNRFLCAPRTTPN